MNVFKVVAGVLFFVFIVACSSGMERKSDNYYKNRKNEDNNRTHILNLSKTKRPGNICESETRDHECREMCKKIYRRIGDKKDCEKLTAPQVEKLFELYELLEDPDEDDLNSIESLDFDVYLNVSIASLEDLIDDEWNSYSAREFLSWLAKNEDFIRIFENEDKDFTALTQLLRKLINFNYNEIYKPFIEKIEDGRLMEVAIKSKNEKLIKWFMDYIEDKNPSCKEETVSRDCFEIYCKIGKKIDDDQMKNWLNYQEFSGYIEKIIENKINANNSDDPNMSNRGDGNGWEYGNESKQFKEINEINSDWVTELCGGLS